MRAAAAFDDWADAGRDRGMETRHWHTAKHALAGIPLDDDDRVLDLGCGSGYAARALVERGAALAVGVDASREMVRNARAYAATAAYPDRLGFTRAGFGQLPFAPSAFDHAFSMEAIYYAPDLPAALRECRRVLKSGGTCTLAVNFWQENHHSHGWTDLVDAPMTCWSEREYREGLRAAGFHVASQCRVPDRDTEIPPADAFPTEDWATREAMVERYREFGTLVTVGVVP